MTSHDGSTSGTFRVLTVASLQRLKIEAFILAPADSEMQSVIKFLKDKPGRMLSAGVGLLHVNARPHVQHLLQEFSRGGEGAFNHPSGFFAQSHSFIAETLPAQQEDGAAPRPSWSLGLRSVQQLRHNIAMAVFTSLPGLSNLADTRARGGAYPRPDAGTSTPDF